jgi:lysine-specific demethylase 3
VWDIWRPEDALRISAFLKELAKARGLSAQSSECPIHDQFFYLGERERKRLLDAYGIASYRFIQRLGDMVVIPAGAPHQVRNLSACVKVAMDFVSPNHLHRCLELSADFKKLRSGHHLSEDKLQVQAMLYQALKTVLLPQPQPAAAAAATGSGAAAEAAGQQQTSPS